MAIKFLQHQCKHGVGLFKFKRVKFKQNKAVNAPFKFETIVMVMSSTHKGHKDNFRIFSAIKEVRLEMRQLFPWKKI